MAIDIKDLVNQLTQEYKTTILSEVSTNSPDIMAAATSYISQGEERLKSLALGALNGELSYEFVVLRLKEEEITLKDTLIGLEQMVAADVTTLINKLIAIFETLLKNAILSLNPISF